MTTEVKSMVAKLLARENITIQRGKYETASFNLKTRVLQLPLWENINNAVLDLFIGHEISHALNTPADGAELFAAKCKGIPFSVCNIIEDIRIEKMVQKEYPGLISSFKAGYKFLYDNDFFKLGEIEMSERTLIDRINIKAKLGSLVEVPFEDFEMELVNAAFNCKTYDDVLDAVNLFKEKQGELEQEPEPNNSGEGDGDSETEELTDEEKEALSDMTDDYDSDSTNDSDSDSDMSDWMAPEDGGEKTDSDQDGDSETSSESTEDSTEDSSNDLSDADDGWKDDGTEAEAVEARTPIKSAGQYGSQSQDALNESLNNDRLDKNLDDHHGDFNFIAPTNKMIEDSIIKYAEVKKSRLESSRFQDALTQGFEGDWDNNWERTNAIESFRNFNATSKKFVNNLKMEFEMKKSAYQYTRATVAKTGKLDVNKIHSYKYSEDIFNSVTTLADAKSHGMIFLIDMSGSMGNIIGTIYKQTINLAMFCKAVGIPFKVYGFTSRYHMGSHISYEDLQDGQFNMGDLHMVELLHSGLKKSQWKEAIFHMYCAAEIFSSRGEPSDMERMGGTPLGLATIALMKKVKDFIKEHKIEKTSVMYLTDGSGHRPDCKGHHLGYGGKGHGKMNGKMVSFSRDVEKELIDHLKDTTGATLTHFFIVSNKYDTRQAGYPSLDNEEWKQIRKTKIITRDGAGGFDRVFIIKNDRVDLNNSNDFSQVQTTGMKDHQLLNAFKKNQTSRKNDRIFVNKFMEMVA